MLTMASADSLASKLIGATIKTPTNETIGDVSDLVVDESGEIKAVIAGVGGLLGIGEQNVMLNFHQLHFNRDGNDRLVAVSPMSRDHVKALPAWHEPTAMHQ